MSELLAFLGSPESYAHAPVSVELVQTHGSIAALAGELVYKVRKSVNFGFLDYSTLERRRHFAHREIELNRRLAPTVYIDVLPIVRRSGRLAFGAPDSAEEAVEYAVHMHRLKEEWFLSSLLAHNQVAPSHVWRILDALVPFYQSSPPSPGGSRERIRHAVIGNLDLCAKALGPVLPAPSYAALRRHGENFIAGYAELFNRRVAEGWIRDGHGDLRPMHIHLAPERVSIYDCIEFNDNLRCIDVAADVAFLGMELAFARRWDLSELFLTEMGARLDDADMPRLLPPYQCYRAAVRGKVAWLLAQEVEVAKDRRSAAMDESKAYFQLALRYALFGSRPVVLCVMGCVGTGKSTLAGVLAEHLGWAVISSDRVRKELAGIDLHARVQGARREELYSASSTARTFARLTELALEELEKHRGVVLDATFGRRAMREQIERAVGKAGAEVIFVELTAPDEVIRQRLAARAEQADVISDARLEDIAALLSTYEPPLELRPHQHVRVDSAMAIDVMVDHLWRKVSI